MDLQFIDLFGLVCLTIESNPSYKIKVQHDGISPSFKHNLF